MVLLGSFATDGGWNKRNHSKCQQFMQSLLFSQTNIGKYWCRSESI